MNSLLRTWAAVRPRAWNALAAAELQSLQDLQRLADAATGRVASPTRSRLRPDWPGDLFRAAMAQSQSDDFFRDLPGWEQLLKETDEKKRMMKDKETESKTPEPAAETPKTESKAESKADKEPPSRFSAYSFSHSSVVGADGTRVASTRRRYEDSSGRLKAELEREVGGVKHRALWARPAAAEGSDGAPGSHETSVTGGSADEFERLWARTPFAKLGVEETTAEDKEESVQKAKEVEKEPPRTE